MDVRILCAQIATPTTSAAIEFTEFVDSNPDFLRAYQATLVGGGSATVKIQASNDNLDFVTLATISLDSTTTSDGFSSAVPWRYVRANTTAVATGKVTATVTE
jgi:hypothetical protein